MRLHYVPSELANKDRTKITIAEAAELLADLDTWSFQIPRPFLTLSAVDDDGQIHSRLREQLARANDPEVYKERSTQAKNLVTDVFHALIEQQKENLDSGNLLPRNTRLASSLRDRLNREAGNKEQALLDELSSFFNMLMTAVWDKEILPSESGYLHTPQVARWAKDKGLLVSKLEPFVEHEGNDRSDAEVVPDTLKTIYTTRLLELQQAAMERFWGTPKKRTPDGATKGDTIVAWMIDEWKARNIPGAPSRTLCEKMQTIIRPDHLK